MRLWRRRTFSGRMRLWRRRTFPGRMRFAGLTDILRKMHDE